MCSDGIVYDRTSSDGFPRDPSRAACASLSLFHMSYQLVFHPEHRITVDEALGHAYLADLHGQVRLSVVPSVAPQCIGLAELKKLQPLSATVIIVGNE